MSSYVGTSVSYIFSPTAGTINFSSQPNFNPAFVKAITDVTQNTFIYLPGITGFGGTWNSTGQILTLQANVSSYSPTDILLIQYDDQQDALNNIQMTLMGKLSQSTLNQNTYLNSNSIPGAVFYSPNIQDLLKSLIAEVRLNTMMFCMQARDDADLDAIKRQILDIIIT